MKLSRVIFTLTAISVFFINCPAGAPTAGKAGRNPPSRTRARPVEVKANVMVWDAAGSSPVSDIKAEDLRVFEDEKEQKITYFARKEPVLNLALVVDNSGSTRPILDKVIAIGSNLVDALRPKDEALIVRFVSRDKIEVTQNWTSEKSLLKIALDNMFIEGGQTAVIDAVYLTAGQVLERERQDKSKRYAIVLISDGVDRDSFYKLDQMLALFKDTDVQVFQFAFPDKEEIKQARRRGKATPLNNLLALETGGAAYNLSERYSEGEVGEALRKMAVELQSNYVIGYVSTNEKRDGKPRKLRVEVADDAKGGKRRAFIRDGFIVPQN